MQFELKKCEHKLCYSLFVIQLISQQCQVKQQLLCSLAETPKSQQTIWLILIVGIGPFLTHHHWSPDKSICQWSNGQCHSRVEQYQSKNENNSQHVLGWRQTRICAYFYTEYGLVNNLPNRCHSVTGWQACGTNEQIRSLAAFAIQHVIHSILYSVIEQHF